MQFLRSSPPLKVRRLAMGFKLNDYLRCKVELVTRKIFVQQFGESVISDDQTACIEI